MARRKVDRVEAERELSSPLLTRLRRLIDRVPQRTVALWPDIERVDAWVHAAVHVMSNEKGENAAPVRHRFDGLVVVMRRHRDRAGTLTPAAKHFVKVTRSHRLGLFRGFAVRGLPRTNNGIEQLLGSQRYHERRASGRKAASPAAVLRSEVCLIATTTTRLRPPIALELGRAAGSSGAGYIRASTSAAMHARCAPDSAATPKPTWPNSDRKLASQLWHFER